MRCVRCFCISEYFEDHPDYKGFSICSVCQDDLRKFAPKHLWGEIDQWYPIPNVPARNLLEKEGLVHEGSGPRWAVALSVAWTRSNVWTTANHDIQFANLFDRCAGDQELQSAVATAYFVGMPLFEILGMIQDWDEGKCRNV